MDSTISISGLWQVLKQNWWKILAVTLIVVMLTAAFTVLFIPKKYASSTEFYIVNINQNVEHFDSGTLSATEYLAPNYIAILKGDTMMQHLALTLKEKEGIELSPGQLRSMISTSTSGTQSTFTVTVTDSNPSRAYIIAKHLTAEAPSIITRIARPSEKGNEGDRFNVQVPVTSTMDELAVALRRIDEAKYKDLADQLAKVHRDARDNNDQLLMSYEATILGYYEGNVFDCITPLRMPTENSSPVSPSLTRNCLIAGALSAVAMYMIFLLMHVFNTTVYTEDDIKAITDLPILGTIPSWQNGTPVSQTEQQQKEDTVQ